MRVALMLLLCLGVPSVGASEAPLSVKGATTINAVQARQLYEFGVLFIDVRPAREWGWGHVHGALHLALERRFDELASPDWPRAMPILSACSGCITMTAVCCGCACCCRTSPSWMRCLPRCAKPS